MSDEQVVEEKANLKASELRHNVSLLLAQASVYRAESEVLAKESIVVEGASLASSLLGSYSGDPRFFAVSFGLGVVGALPLAGSYIDKWMVGRRLNQIRKVRAERNVQNRW